MALASTLIWELTQAAGGSDTNGGAFCPDASVCTFDTDLACPGNGSAYSTSTAPHVSSATYTFTSSDIGCYLYIVSGTSWTPGWYQITGVNASPNYATLNAAVGSAFTMIGKQPAYTNTAAGCGSSGTSITTGTWSIDRSAFQTAAWMALDGTTNYLTATGTGNTVTVNGYTVTQADVGNVLYTSGSGTTMTQGRWVITAVNTGTNAWTVAGSAANLSTGSSSTTSGYQGGYFGGALANVAGTSGLMSSYGMVGGNQVFIKYNATPYTISTQVTTIPAGAYTEFTRIIGYNTIRTRANTDASRPTLKAAASYPSSNIFNNTGSYIEYKNLIFDTNNQATTGISMGGSVQRCINCKVYSSVTATAVSGYGIYANGQVHVINCEVSGLKIQNSGGAIQIAGNSSLVLNCEVHGCSPNSGTTYGFYINATNVVCISCISWKNTGSCDGFYVASGYSMYS